MRKIIYGPSVGEVLLRCALIKTTKRITFEILYQADRVTNKSDTGILHFVASNGYDVISEHRMDIQSRRIWLHGAANDQPANRSGTMAIPTQEMCDETFPEYSNALEEWAKHNNGIVVVYVVDFVENKESY